MECFEWRYSLNPKSPCHLCYMGSVSLWRKYPMSIKGTCILCTLVKFLFCSLFISEWPYGIYYLSCSLTGIIHPFLWCIWIGICQIFLSYHLAEGWILCLGEFIKIKVLWKCLFLALTREWDEVFIVCPKYFLFHLQIFCFLHFLFLYISTSGKEHRHLINLLPSDTFKSIK